MSYMDKYKEWLDGDAFDTDTKAELRAIAGDEKEIEDRFYKDLAFGTGGLRGVMGAGTNRMNIYTVCKATQGLANYILKEQRSGTPSVALAYDSRHRSPEFAEEAALVLNGNGIATYLFESLRPTPELSFAVRELGCTAGIVVTASHNPSEYNGYKVYWSDGGQVPYPRDGEIIDEVEKLADFAAVKRADRAEAEKAGLFHRIGAAIDDQYIAAVKRQIVNHAVLRTAHELSVVYTPLHGAGNKPVRRVLTEAGFRVHVVPEQEQPDGGFPTVGYPNPEDPKAFTLALRLAAEQQADLVIATDPDSDRIGVAVRMSEPSGNTEYRMLTGNMTGTLLTEYILSHRKMADDLRPAVVSTIVSTDMTARIAEAHGADYFEVLTGFKYIGEKIKQFEADGSHTFLFGFEESYGALAGTHARDKDAVVAALLVCEMAAYYKTRGMTLCDGLVELYEKYGYYKESVESVTLPGVDGLANIERIMARLRTTPPTRVGGAEVIALRDYKNNVVKDTRTGAVGETGLPTSDVLYFVLDGGAWFCVRPSGTEPKIKIYFGVRADSQAAADATLAAVEKDAMQAVMG